MEFFVKFDWRMSVFAFVKKGRQRCDYLRKGGTSLYIVRAFK